MGQNLYDIFETSDDLEQEGISVRYGDAVFLIARAGGANRDFLTFMEKEMRPYRSSLQAGTMENEIAEDILRAAFAKHVVLDWEGVTDREGEEIDYSYEAADQLFKNLPDLFADLQTQAQKVSNYVRESIEADAKD